MLRGATRRWVWPFVLLTSMQGCTSFAAVRSAEVSPGRSVDLGVTVATPPGDAAAWFWTYDCASRCNRAIPSVDVRFTHGTVPEGSARPYEVGGGLSGFYPYVHGYLQLRRGHRPVGVGAWISLAPNGWFEGAVFARHDVPLGRGSRLLLAPTLFHHWGNSPNGMNPGSFTALAQGVGLERKIGGVPITPTLLMVVGWVDRSSYGRRTTDVTAFAVVGLNVGIGR